MHFVFLLIFIVSCQNLGKMNQADDEESVDNAVFANEFVSNEAPMELGVAESFLLPPAVGDVVFQVLSLMLHLLQINGIFGGKAIEDANQHLSNFVEVCLPCKVRCIS